MNDYHFVFGGASITDSPWLTWKDFVIDRYQLTDYSVCAFKGIGNEFISWSVLNSLKTNSFVCIMFTSVDKWDWLVDNPTTVQLINQHEKHKVIDLQGQQTDQGFWCTGSWFPAFKEYYAEHYFSPTYFLAKSLEKIFFLQSVLKQKNIPYLFLFDSPLLEFAEQDLNQNAANGSLLQYFNSPYVQLWHDQIDWSNIYQPGLIGYCKSNNLPWISSRFGTHPPSSSHLSFCHNHVFPELDKYLTPVENDLTKQAEKFDKMWTP